MKIDKVFVICCKADFYLTKICVASIRFWNKTIPIDLIKDYSQGNFETSELEHAFNVSVFNTRLKKMGPYSKLVPFIEEKGKRVFVIDSDIVWMRNAIPELETFSEDLVVHAFYPLEPEKEMSSWYFNLNNLEKYYNGYVYPGFLFNGGQFVCNTSAFSKEDFNDTIAWQENVKPIHDNTFLCEDQGILNYAIARRINNSSISYQSYPFYSWGYEKTVNKIDVREMNYSKTLPPLIHWLGKKTGLISGLNGEKILNFYEEYYYSQIADGKQKLIAARWNRTLQHPLNYAKSIIKGLFT